MKYEKSLMEKWDEYAILKTAKEKGIEEGIEKGIKQGIEKGIRKGIEKGKTEEVKNLILKLGFSDTQAADVADVPVSFATKVGVI